MKAYIFRRTLYTIPVFLGVYIITFFMFHMRDPITIARVHLPQAPLPVLQNWVRNHDYHRPLFLNLPYHAETERADGQKHPEFAEKSIFHSRFFLGLKSVTTLDFGVDRNRLNILAAMKMRLIPSLSIMVPAFFLALIISIILALVSVAAKGSIIDRNLVLFSSIMLGIALPSYLLASAFFFGMKFRIMPIYGHVALPILVAVVASVGSQIRFYRTVFLEESSRPHIMAARIRGVSEKRILTDHVLRNALIPVLTSVIMSLPFLITGSLLLEQFFGIPGMGDMLFTAIVSQDFPVIRAMVYLGSILYMLGALLTDISYAIADPRIQFS